MSKKTKSLTITIACIILGGILLLESYARWPASFTVEMPKPESGTTHLIMLFHGSEGEDNAAIISLEEELQKQIDTKNTQVIRYIWAPWSDNRVRASTNGKHIGELIGKHLAGYNIDQLHLIGHSAGAWLPDAICRKIRQEKPSKSLVRITLLDPIGINGVLDLGWGQRHFGECADFAEAILNTNDNVPGTNVALQNAFNIDVTKLEHNKNGHEWPVWYYLDNLGGASLTLTASHTMLPRGAIAKDSKEFESTRE